MILVLSAEFSPLINQSQDGHPDDAIEAVTRKYNEFCSGGSWTAECFNGFWAYIHPITDVLVNPSMLNNLANNPRYYDSEELAKYESLASEVLHNPELGGYMKDRPSDWANASVSLANTLKDYPHLRYSFYPLNNNFTIYTRDQYYALQTYISCGNGSDCLNDWIIGDQ